MITLVILFVLVALAIAFTLAVGLGPIAIVPVMLAVGFGIWLLARLAFEPTSGRAASQTHEPELLERRGPPRLP